MKPNGYGFILGRNEAAGDFKDVRVRTTPEGLNYLEIARDPRNLTPRTYVIDRRLTPNGAWYRVLDIKAFEENTLPEEASETTAIVTYEDFENFWSIVPEHTFGLPSGMESPWYAPLEMVGNELLLPDGASWVSGDAPTNVFQENAYSNGKYTIIVEESGISFNINGGRRLAFLGTEVGDPGGLQTIEGTAGVMSLDGGVLFIEPAKPPMFIGNFTLLKQPRLIRPGLYDADECYFISTHPINEGRGGGAISILVDPYPERWIPRMMCRAFVELSSPGNVPPFIEDEPNRISIGIVYPENDFPDVAPEITTPYANEYGVFNSWEAEGGEVVYHPSERPWDVLLPFDGNADDYGGHATRGDYIPGNDRVGDPLASFPNSNGYTVYDISELREATLFLRWSDSAEFQVLKNPDHDIYYKRGYFYFSSQPFPESDGLAQISAVPGWNDTKFDWTSSKLIVNDEPAMQDKYSWLDTMVRVDGTIRTWGDILGVYQEEWVPNPDLPITVHQYLEQPPEWVTGQPEGETVYPDTRFLTAPRTWGRVLYEGFGNPVAILAGDETVPLVDIGHYRLEELL